MKKTQCEIVTLLLYSKSLILSFTLIQEAYCIIKDYIKLILQQPYLLSDVNKLLKTKSSRDYETIQQTTASMSHIMFLSTLASWIFTQKLFKKLSKCEIGIISNGDASCHINLSSMKNLQ